MSDHGMSRDCADKIVADGPKILLVKKETAISGIDGREGREAAVVGVGVIAAFVIQIGQAEDVRFHRRFDGAIEGVKRPIGSPISQKSARFAG